MSYRVGLGYDIHRLVEGRALFIGGVEIPYVSGCFGHSDGDVLLHAICDALLGAAAKGDIGEHFPDTDPAFYNIASEKLLAHVTELLRKERFVIQNIDTIVIAQEPTLTPFKKKIIKNIARILAIEEHLVCVKAKTNEGLDGVGKKEAIAAYATALIMKEE